jgi:hypothetical protein
MTLAARSGTAPDSGYADSRSASWAAAPVRLLLLDRLPGQRRQGERSSRRVARLRDPVDAFPADFLGIEF